MPVCQRCKKGGRNCEYPTQTNGRGFRHDKNPSVKRSVSSTATLEFSDQHKWISLPNHGMLIALSGVTVVEFVDETAMVAAEYSSGDSGEPSAQHSPTSLLPNLSALTPSALPAFSPLGAGTSPEEIANARTALTIQQLLEDRNKDANAAHPASLSPVSLSELARVHSIRTDPESSSPLLVPAITLDESRARLLRHYILTLGPWVFPLLALLIVVGHHRHGRTFHTPSP